MINLFIGDNDFLIKQKIVSWKNLFLEKYGDLNIIHLKNISDFEIGNVLGDLITPGFMGQKKLIIIDNIPSNSSSKNSLLEEEISKILDKIPETNIVIFNSISPDKRAKFFKEIKKKADKIEEFYISGENEIINLLEKKYSGKISKSGIYEIIKYKQKNYTKIISEIEKLLITYDFIDEKIIRQHIIPELDESIFIFIDNILSNNITLVLKNFRIILANSNFYQFYNGLLSNLRNTVYIKKFKQLKIPKSEIVNKLKLGNKAFLIDKRYNLNYTKLEKLYFDLIDFDKKMKSGELIGSKQKDLVFEIEKIFLKNLI